MGPALIGLAEIFERLRPTCWFSWETVMKPWPQPAAIMHHIPIVAGGD